MTFANPLALLWGLLAVPIVLLYLRRIRLARAPVATSMIWEQVFAEDRARSSWQRWRHGVSLAVQLTVLVLVVIALAEPQFGAPRRRVLIVDNSSGTDVAQGQPKWLPEAVKLAASLIEELRSCDRAALVSCGGSVTVWCNLSDDLPLLQERLEAIPHSDRAAQADAAVALARRMLADAPGGEIVLLSDATFPHAIGLVADDVRLVRIGRPADNVAITRLDVRRNIDDPLSCQVLIELTSFSDKPAEFGLNVEFNDKPLTTLPIKLGKDERWCQVFEMTTPDSGELTVRLDRQDFAGDNEASVLVPPAPIRRVILVTGGNPKLQSVLRADALVELTVSKQAPAKVPTGAILVFDRQIPQALPTGAVLVVDPAGSCDLWQLGQALDNPTVAAQDLGSPVLEHVQLEGTALPGAKRLAFTDAARTSARRLAWTSDDAPLVCAIDRPGGRVLVLLGDLQTGSLPLQTAFPILMTNALDWLAGDAAGDGSRRAVVWHPPKRSSDFRTPGNPGTEATLVAARPAGAPPWLYLAIAGVALLAVEWCLYQRRWIS